MLQFHFASLKCKFQSLVTIKIKKERGKNEKEEKRNNDRSRDWKKKAPKPCEVLQPGKGRFFAKLSNQ